MLRLGVGDTVAVFDGRGHEFLARVVAARAPRRARADCCRASSRPAEPRVALTLAQAVLKGDKMDDVVRDAVMLGVAAIQPIVTKRTETTVAALMQGARVERWRRVALASVKQSRRAVLPEIRMPLTFETLLDEPPPALRADAGRAGARRPTSSRCRRFAGRRRRPTRRCSSGPKADGPRRSGASRRARGVRLVTLGRARCAPTPCRSRRSACCSFCGASSSRHVRLQARTFSMRTQILDSTRVYLKLP